MAWVHGGSVRISVLAVLVACSDGSSVSEGPGDTEDIRLPDMQVSPRDIWFPATADPTPVSETVILGNDGLGPLTVTGISLDGDPSFALDVAPAPLVLAPGEQTAAVITYTPDLEEVTSRLTIEGDDPQAPRLVLSVRGDGLLPGSLLLPETVALGTTRPRCRLDAVVQVSNPGSTPVTGALNALPSELELGLEALRVEPGETVDIPVSWTPTDAGELEGELYVDSDAGQWIVPIEGIADPEAPGRCETVWIANTLERLDLAIVVDATDGATTRREALATVIDDVIETLHREVPDLTVSLGLYSDYGQSRPWSLALQQTDDWPELGPLLADLPRADTPMAAAFEALVQAGSGLGHDADCDGTYDDDDSSPFRVDLLFGGGQTTYDPSVSGTGSDRGTGFRSETTSGILHVAGSPIRSPVAGDPVPGGCPFDADLQSVFEAWAYSGARYGAVGTDDYLPLIAAELLSFADLDGDGRDELAVIDGTNDPEALREQIGNLLEAIVEGRSGVTLSFTVEAPDAEVVISPTVARELLPGQEVAVDVTSPSGTFVSTAGADTVPVTVTARSDGRIVATRELHLRP